MRPSETDRTGKSLACGDDRTAEACAVEVLHELDAVIVELEAATEGSAALDGRVHFGFRVLADQSPDIAALLIAEGISWPTVQLVLDDVIPPYTTSLDAAIDGENVMLVLRSAKRKRWGAMQRTSWGSEVMGWAATEALARRLVALKTHRAEMAAAVEEERKLRERRDADRASIDRPAADMETAWTAPAALTGTDDRIRGERVEEREKDWEVLF